jgi:hypothetical protein
MSDEIQVQALSMGFKHTLGYVAEIVGDGAAENVLKAIAEAKQHGFNEIQVVARPIAGGTGIPGGRANILVIGTRKT